MNKEGPLGPPPRWNPSEDGGGTAPKRSGETAVFDPHSKTTMVGFDMTGFGIKNLSMGLLNFSFITELRLANNRLKGLPAGLSQLQCLVYLDLSNNQLMELPKEIGWLTELKELLLYNNQLQDLPPEMGFLFQLESLGLDGNPISNEALLSVLHSQGPVAIIPFLRDHIICKLSPAGCPLIRSVALMPPSERAWHSIETTSSGRTASCFGATDTV